ncbi:TRAFs-binding domain-containing protein [Streptococcus cristatus]|jgi:hypothetical protein|uniref:Uncharacterized protein n=1 Tax=Streptococcus cristatus TaxID=45634 RepID=A0A428GXW8_STRCR|nr:TRAFs-binding domain-containing protein [Streptococcus cristatus]RSJ88511.1 hypothetical protein D8792_09100 [Streptococcus cristatus]
MKNKVCFVVMGFGKKTYFKTNELIDLDEIYNEVIKPLFEKEFQNYKVIRADDVAGSTIIDVSMYELLLHADLVIADLTTYNINAAYELGVRHAAKPFSTVMMIQEDHDIPFDLNHSRIYRYKKFGEKISKSESDEMMSKLKKYIKESEKQQTDSPLYTYIPKVKPLQYDNNYYCKLISDAENYSDTIGELLQKAKDLKKKGNFVESKNCWKKLVEKSPGEDYFIQQLALATYKSKVPNETRALMEALKIIQQLPLKKTLDTETLGIAGAIYKRLYRVNKNPDYLEDAINIYRKGYIVKQDYYNGENYANCLLLQLLHITDKEQIKYNQFEANKVYRELIDLITENADEDDYWKYATLAVAYYYLECETLYKQYLDVFKSKSVSWEQASLQETIDEIEKIRQHLI